MGWTTPYKSQSPRRQSEELRYFIANFTWSGPELSGGIREGFKVGTTWYLLAELAIAEGGNIALARPYQPNASGRFSFAIVVLTDRIGGEWSYKDIGETAGPCEDQAPPALIKKLSPIADPVGGKHAAEWRDRCIANAPTRHAEATPAGLQYIIPGAEKRQRPSAQQLELLF